MSKMSYLYTNVFGAIRTTGSNCFSSNRDENGKYAAVVMNSLDIKYKLNQEIVYKYINADSPLYLGNKLKTNEKVFFGAYASLKNSNGRSNNANIAYRFLCNSEDITFNPGYLINNSYFIGNIYNETLTNDTWLENILGDGTIESKINNTMENIQFGDLVLSPVTDITSSYYNYYRNVVLQVLDALVANNFKKKVIIQGNTIDNTYIIQMVLLLLPIDIAKNLSFNTNVKDGFSLSEVNIAGVSDSINVSFDNDTIIINGNDKINITTYYAKLLGVSKTLFTCVEKLEYNGVNKEDQYSLNLDAIFFNDVNIMKGIDFLKYAFENYDVSILVKEPIVLNFVDQLLFNTNLIIKLDKELLAKYIVLAKYEEDGILKPYCLKFMENLNTAIFLEHEKIRYSYLSALAGLIINDPSIVNLLNVHNFGLLCNAFNESLITFLDNCLSDDIEDYFFTIIDLMIKYLSDQKELYDSCLQALFNNYENETAIKTLELLFNNVPNEDYAYIILRGITLSNVEIYLDEDASNNKMKIYTFIKNIITNPSNIDKNVNFYTEIKMIDDSIDLSWLENNLIKPISSLKEVYELNANITDVNMLHQIHKMTSLYFSNHLDEINYDTYQKIKPIYDKFEDDNVNDFVEIEEIVVNRIILIGNEISLITNSKSILTGEFNKKRTMFISKLNQLFGDNVNISNSSQVTNSLFKPRKTGDTVVAPIPVKTHPVVSNVKTKKLDKGNANSNDNFKILLIAACLVIGCLIIMIPIFTFAQNLVKYCLLFGVLSIVVSFRELIRFRNESFQKKRHYVIVNNIFIVYIPLILFICAIMFIMYVL